MKSQAEFQTALHWFCKEVGVPVDLVVDAHRAQTSNKVQRFCDQVGTTLRILEKGTHWANRVELYIGLLKEAVRKDMRESNSPMVLWDYAIEQRAAINNLVPRPLFQNNVKLLMLLPLDLKVIYPTCVTLDGMSGCIIEIMVHFLKIKKSLDMC